MHNRTGQKKYRFSCRETINGENKKFASSQISNHIKNTRAVFLISSLLLLHANTASAWFVNAYLLYQTGLPDAYSAADVGCALSSGKTRVASVNYTSIEPAAATVVCESYDETTDKWWYWRAPFIAEEPGDSEYFMDAGTFDNVDQGKADVCSKNPINLISGNKYKIYTDIESEIQRGVNRPGFKRYYNSQLTKKYSTIGNKWTHTYDRRMIRQDALQTANNLRYSSGGSESDAGQSSNYSSRQAACESGIAEIRAQAQGLAPGPFQNLKAFINADAQWENDECRIYVDGRYRANFPILTHGIQRDGGSSWDHYLWFYRADGNVIRFQKTFSGSYQNLVTRWKETTNTGYLLDEIDITPPPVNNEVATSQVNYVLTDPGNVKETYDNTGKLLYIDYPNGVHEALSYLDDRVVRASNSLGQYVDIQYGVDGYIENVSDETGRTWKYRYLDTNLVEVINPDLTSVKYHYEDSAFPGALTGVTDERNIRVSTFEYYQDGLARSSYLGQPGALPELRIENVDVVYGAISNTVTNSRGYRSTYHFSGDVLEGLLYQYDGPECIGCNGGSSSYIYDINLQSPKDSTLNLLSSVDYGLKTTYENHDENGNPGVVTEAVATPEQRSTVYTYDPRYHDKVKTKTEPSIYAAGSKVTTYTYDDFTNTTSIMISGYAPDGTPVSRSQSFVYNGPYHQLSEINGPRIDVDDTTIIEYYEDTATEGDNRARVRSITAPPGVVLYDNITYTPTGKQASYITGTNLQVDYTYYPGNDRLETQTLTDLSTGEARSTHWTYLATGEVESITQGYATPEASMLTFEYDDARRLTRIYNAFNNYIEYELDTEGNVINEYIYDQAGLLLKSLSQSFDAYNRLDISAQLNETRDHNYSPDGTLDLETNGKNVVTDYNYDALRRLTSISQDVGGTDPSSANALTRFDYDVQDNLVSVKDPNGGQTSYAYDDLGNLISLVSPDTGTSHYTYDEAGNIATMTDAKGQVFKYTYDAMGRLTLSDAPGISDDITYVYDSCENGTGRLCTVVRDAVAVSYRYTAFGDIKSFTQTIATFPSYEQASAQVSYSYDAAGRIQDMIYPGGNKVTYTYDAAGNVYSVILNGGEKNLVSEARYYPFGPERIVTRGNGSSIFGYMDQAYRTFITGHGGYFYDVIYYDANGNPATFYSSEGSKNHTYDALDRLDTSSGPYGSRDYDYDINGNRTREQVDSVSNNYSYDTNTNRMNINAGNAVMMDANGNTTSLGGMNISYTSDNRVSNISGNAFYSYNGLGERSMKALRASGAAGTHGYQQKTVYIYGIDGKLMAETGSSGKIKQEYIYLNDKLLATIVYEPAGGESILNADMDNDGAVGVDDFLVWYYNHYNTGDISRDLNADDLLDTNDINLAVNCALSGGTAAGCTTSSYSTSIYYAHNDHLGTSHMLSNESGVAVWRAVYDPFGKATVNEDLDDDGNSVTLNMRFPGQYYDTESGLHYNYFRHYNPETGRYITSDPIGLSGGSNTYSYVLSNPIAYIDALGLDVIVTLYKGQNGNIFNHIGVGTTTGSKANKTFGLGPDSGIGLLFPVPGHVSQDRGEPIATLTIPTSAVQDALVNAYNDAAMKYPSLYSLPNNSCVDHVRDALYVGGINIPKNSQNTNLPNNLFNSLSTLGTLTYY